MNNSVFLGGYAKNPDFLGMRLVKIDTCLKSAYVCLHCIKVVDHFKNGRQCKAPVFLSCVLTRFMAVVEQEDTVVILIER